MNKLWFIQTKEYYSTVKKKKLSSHEKTWRKCECIFLREISQTERAVSITMGPTIGYCAKKKKKTENTKTMVTVKRSVVSRGGGEMNAEG